MSKNPVQFKIRSFRAGAGLMVLALSLFLTLPSMTGCFSTDAQKKMGLRDEDPSIESSSEEAAAASGEKSSAPFVEAYIEFGGPDEKWVGPTPFLVHVTTHDTSTDAALISVSPPLFRAPSGSELADGGIEDRRPASLGMSKSIARDQLESLAKSAFADSRGEAFRGCLSPLRIRLVRADGSTVERYGCRSTEGWPMLASELVSGFIQSGFGQQ